MRGLILILATTMAACAPGTFKGDEDGGAQTDTGNGGGDDAGPRDRQVTSGVRVDFVNDGDTIILAASSGVLTPDGLPLDNERVRFLGVDAPEIEHPPTPAQCHGDEAHAYLQGQIDGRIIDIEYDETKCKPPTDTSGCRDDFGRLLAYVIFQGKVMNQEMLRLGHARSFGGGRFSHRDSDAYARLEAAAESANLGLWACP